MSGGWDCIASSSEAARLWTQNGSTTTMKVNIEIECTPVEARQFFGLPDLEPLQAAGTERLQKEMLASMDPISPEAMMRTWLSFMPRAAERHWGALLDHALPPPLRPPGDRHGNGHVQSRRA